jgi:hypothetical protein
MEPEPEPWPKPGREPESRSRAGGCGPASVGRGPALTAAIAGAITLARVSGRLGWVVPVAVVLAVVAGIGAGFGIRELSAQAGGSVGAGPAATTEAGPPPGSSTVGLSQDAAAHPRADSIRVLLQRHFDAINNRDYAAWASTVVVRRSTEMPRPVWEAEYASTRDGSILLQRIEPSSDGVVVLVSFVSTQSAANAPVNLPGATCTRWWVSYRVVDEGGLPRIDAGVRHSTINAACT